MVSFSVKYGSAEKAIDGWFNALAQEYIAADNLNKNEDTKIVIDSINDGFIIRAIDKLTDNERIIFQIQSTSLKLLDESKVSFEIDCCFSGFINFNVLIL